MSETIIALMLISLLIFSASLFLTQAQPDWKSSPDPCVAHTDTVLEEYNCKGLIPDFGGNLNG